MLDMSDFEAAASAVLDDDAVIHRIVRLQELAWAMFGAIADYADDLPEEVTNAAEDWYSVLAESGTDS